MLFETNPLEENIQKTNLTSVIGIREWGKNCSFHFKFKIKTPKFV